MRIYELFAGGGIAGHIAPSLGWQSVGACEINKWARAVYRYNNHPQWGIDHDARELVPGRMPEFDCLVFGWPCQDNSLAGKRAGQREGTRSGLLSEAARILRAKRPAYFIAENVPGLFSVNGGVDFIETILLSTDLGYDIQWQVLNACWFLPQNRERIYFVGHRRGKPRPQVFPVTKGDFDLAKSGGGEEQQRVYAKGCDSSHYKGADGKRTVVMECGTLHHRRGFEKNPDGLSPTLRTGHGDKRGIVRVDGGSAKQRNRIYHSEGIAPTLTSGGSGGNHCAKIFVSDGRINKSSTDQTTPSEKAHTLTGPPNIHGVRAVLTPGRTNKRQSGRRIKGENEPMFTLTSTDVHGIQIEGLLRYLTPLEYERLFGFPDGYTTRGIDDSGREIVISDTQRYRICGNAMVAPVVRFVMERLGRSSSI